MNSGDERKFDRVWFRVAVVLLLAAIGYIIVVAPISSILTDSYDDVPLLLLSVAALFSLAGWWRDRARWSAERASEREERRRREERVGKLETVLG